MGVLSIPHLSHEEKNVFSRYFNERSISLFRFTVIVMLVASIGYFYLDYLAAPEHYKTFWLIRAFIFVLFIFAFIISYNKKIINRYLQPISNGLNIFYNLGILLMIYISNSAEISYNSYFIGLIVIWITSIPMRVRLIPFISNFFIIVILYYTIAIFKQGLLEKGNIIIFINNSFFILSAIIAVFVADVVLEIFIRHNFLSKKILEEHNSELEQKNVEINTQKEEIYKQKIIIEKRHNQIMESIHYAQTIQKALLPTEEALKSFFKDNFFIYFRPKQTVSGDFYYVNKVNNYLIFAVADCTGHGVPGGFLTMLGITFLHEIVNNQKVNTAGKVLEILRKRIKEVFEKSKSKNRNGLDIVLCALNTETNILQYAGAYNPLFIIRNNEILEYKATRNPIGAYPKEKAFETTEIPILDNDMVYLSSDGYADQFGGEKYEKFSVRNFKNFLLEIHTQTMQEQKKLLDEKLKKWQGYSSQIDDITVMGIKFKKHRI